MKKIFIYSLLICTLFLSACSTDLDVIGNYKETMVVYGLLDQSQTTQYIKINKAFLGEGSALEYAKIKDSTQYVNSLSVVLKRIKSGVELSSYNLTPDNTPQKNSGIFYGPDQANAIYSVATTLYNDSQYKLIIKNNETGTEVSSQTYLLSDATFTAPNPSSPSTSFSIIKVSSNGVPNDNFLIKWYSGRNVKVYQKIIRFNYTDSTSTGNVNLYLDWIFPGQKTQNISGGELMEGDIKGNEFMKFIRNQLSDYSGLIARKAGKVDIILVAGGEDLNTFIEVNAPSTGIIQQKPEFTNITNGLGIFSARYTKPPFSKLMDGTTLDTLACGQYTKGLKFLNKSGILFCP